jgi:hypothetical protein
MGMRQPPAITAQCLLTLLAAVVILRVTAVVVLGYRDYLPPNFNADFLRGREGHFFGPYRGAFYAHIASGPVSLLLGMLLLSQSFRRRWPRWHRRLGRVQVANVLLLVVPSGLWMAWYAIGGPVAVVGFAVLSVLTAGATACGWRAAVQRRFAVHQTWMLRSYLLLCSAVVIRLLGGLAVTLEHHADWLDAAIAWVSWLVPLAVFEMLRGRHGPRGSALSVDAGAMAEINARRSSAGMSAE